MRDIYLPLISFDMPKTYWDALTTSQFCYVKTTSVSAANSKCIFSIARVGRDSKYLISE